MKSLMKFEQKGLSKEDQKELLGGEGKNYYQDARDYIKRLKLRTANKDLKCELLDVAIRYTVRLEYDLINRTVNGSAAYWFREGANDAWEWDGKYCGSDGIV